MRRNGKYLFTSESVGEGHPDKVADQISDSVLDAILCNDPKARVDCETLVMQGNVIVTGQITTSCYVSIPKIVRKTPKELMPLPIMLAHRLVKKLAECRKKGILPYLRPDCKSQVTVEYCNGVPKRVTAVVIAAQHTEKVDSAKMREDVINKVIKEIIPMEMLEAETKYIIK